MYESKIFIFFSNKMHRKVCKNCLMTLYPIIQFIQVIIIFFQPFRQNLGPGGSPMSIISGRRYLHTFTTLDIHIAQIIS